jgi:predicted LPLAT superfamily acyltransferase
MQSPWLYSLAAGGAALLLLGCARGLKRAHRTRREALADRNPGPESGYAWIGWSLQHLPAWFNQLGLRLGAAVALVTMPRQRKWSGEYLRLALGREPGWRDVWRHFHAFSRYLLLRLAIANGHEPRVRFAAGHGDELRAWLATGRPALYGTMHLGNSDLVGFFLGRIGGRVHMIRKQVGNSEDTDRLARRYASHVTFIWINDWSRLILAMNDALRAGCSLAMQCDRPEYSSKLEAFEFFGQERRFPFTIYHLAIMHERPVVLSYAIPDHDDPAGTVVFMLPIFHPRPEAGREANFAAARVHFQGFLATVEAQLRRTPYLWFNFTSMNPPLHQDESRARRSRRYSASEKALRPGAKTLADQTLRS